VAKREIRPAAAKRLQCNKPKASFAHAYRITLCPAFRDVDHKINKLTPENVVTNNFAGALGAHVALSKRSYCEIVCNTFLGVTMEIAIARVGENRQMIVQAFYFTGGIPATPK